MSVLLPNTTQTPNALTDRWMAVLSGAEWKVVSYIVRRTYGFQAPAVTLSAKWIAEGTVSADGARFLDDGTGLSVRAVQSACDALAAEGFLIKTPGPHENSPASFAINLAWEPAMMSAARVSKLAGRAKAVRRRPETSPLPLSDTARGEDLPGSTPAVETAPRKRNVPSPRDDRMSPEAPCPDGDGLDGHRTHLASAGCSHIEPTMQKMHGAEIAYGRNCIASDADFTQHDMQILHSSHTGASEGLNPKPRETKGNQDLPLESPPRGASPPDGSAPLETSDDVAEGKSKGTLHLPKHDPDGFREFVRTYPRHDAPKDASKAWDSVKPDEAAKERIFAKIAAVKALFPGGKLPYGAVRWCKQPGAWLRAERFDSECAFPGVEGWLEEDEKRRRIEAWHDEKDAPALAEAAAVERRRRQADDKAARLEEQREQSRRREAEIDTVYLALPEARRRAIDADALAMARKSNPAIFAVDPNFSKPGGRGFLAGIRREKVAALMEVAA